MRTGLKRVYAEIHGRYESANHILTIGLDVIWRRRAASLAERCSGGRWIDLCTGTGEMAVLLERAADSDCRVHAVDFSMPMLEEARSKREAGGICFTLSGIDDLPFPDACFDLATISFATRNIDRGGETLVNAFREIRRIIRPGGCLINLETSQPRNPIVRALFHSYVRLLVRPVGGAVAGSDEGFAYLSRSILGFHSPQRLSGILLEAGFSEVDWESLFFGAAAIHTAIR
jgi:demethylmenaquinone methyltransferase/2-methoxy-6-polyprenyl-1,4-benzoquinol methylase